MDNEELSEKLEEMLENPRGFLEKFILLTQQVVELKKELRKRWERIEEFDARVQALLEENKSLVNDNTDLLKLLFLHRRFHNKVGCPGGDECYVCKEDNE